MKQVFKAYDGKIFDTQAECENYEQQYMLYQVVAQNCHVEYSDDAGFCVIGVQDAVDFIETHYEKIGDLLGKTKVEDGGWVTNTKMSYGHPDILKGSDYIQVEYSDGEIVYGHASDWSMRWDITGAINHIDKYRKA